MTTARLEAFSDGVFAVAITLLSLGLVDPGARGGLAHNLVAQWPHYAAYVISFLIVGIIWINHHVMVSRLRVADHAVLTLNLLLLMTIVVIPFTTNLMATHLGQTDAGGVGAVVYCGTCLAMAITFSLLHRHVLLGPTDLLVKPLALAERRAILRRSMTGIAPYVVCTAIAYPLPYVAIGITGALSVFYALPIASLPDA